MPKVTRVPGGRGEVRPSLLLGITLGTEPQMPLALGAPRSPHGGQAAGLGSAATSGPRSTPSGNREDGPPVSSDPACPWNPASLAREAGSAVGHTQPCVSPGMGCRSPRAPSQGQRGVEEQPPEPARSHSPSLGARGPGDVKAPHSLAATSVPCHRHKCHVGWELLHPHFLQGD